jgi:hypothetical protein
MPCFFHASKALMQVLQVIEGNSLVTNGFIQKLSNILPVHIPHQENVFRLLFIK